MGFLKIPGMTFSWKRAIGLSALKQKIARKTGVPLTKHGRTLKMGRAAGDMISGKNRGQAAKTMFAMTLFNRMLDGIKW